MLSGFSRDPRSGKLTKCPCPRILQLALKLKGRRRTTLTMMKVARAPSPRSWQNKFTTMWWCLQPRTEAPAFGQTVQATNLQPSNLPATLNAPITNPMPTTNPRAQSRGQLRYFVHLALFHFSCCCFFLIYKIKTLDVCFLMDQVYVISNAAFHLYFVYSHCSNMNVFPFV